MNTSRDRFFFAIRLMRYLRIKDYAWIKSMRDKNVELRMIYGGDNLIARVDI